MPWRSQPSNPKKELWLAVHLSLFLPGLGQIYTGKRLRGLVFIGLWIVLIAIAVWSVFSPMGNTVIGINFLMLVLILYALNLFDVYKSVDLSQKRFKGKATNKDPWFAVFLSQILPGLGHLYIEKVFLGTVLLLGTVVVASIANVFAPLLILPPILVAIACYHTYIAAPQGSPRPRHWITGIAIATIGLRLVIGYLPIFIEKYVEVFEVPSLSMSPTLQVGDRMFVRKTSHYTPKQGDVIVFQPPPAAENQERKNGQADKFYVKRAIGLPGQVVEVKNAIVYLNQQPLQEGYIAEPPTYQWGPVTVPFDSYLVLGDNRNSNFDSHVWGFLPQRNIIGQAYKIYWPPERIKPLN